MKCPVCDSVNFNEVIEDSKGNFGTIIFGAKHSICKDCHFDGTNSVQDEHNLSCKKMELHGPFKPIVIDDIIGANAYFSWVWQGVGFGQLSFEKDTTTGEITCMNECMSRDSVRKLLHEFADYIADNAKLDDL
jgi:hypothetical protein